MSKVEYQQEVSVWLSSNNKVRKYFRCINCGKVVFEYYGTLDKIVIGGNEVSYPYVIECKGTVTSYYPVEMKERCHWKYVIS
jgi:hypothetical protein